MNQILLLPMADNETRRLLFFDDLLSIGQKNYATIQKYEENGGKYYYIAKELYGTWHKALKAHAKYRREYGRNLFPYTGEDNTIRKKMLIDDMFKIISYRHYNKTLDIPFEDYKNNGGKFDLEFIHKIYWDESKKLYKNQSKWKQALHDFYLERERRNKLKWERQFPLVKIVEIIENYYYNNRKRPDERGYLRKVIPYFTKRIKSYGTTKNIIETYSRIPSYEEEIKIYKSKIKTKVKNTKIDILCRRRKESIQNKEELEIYDREIEIQQFIQTFKHDVNKIIEKHGYYSFTLYEKEPNISRHSKDWICKRFGSLEELYSIIGLQDNQRIFTPKKYTDEEYKTYLTNIYNKYGFISVSLINNEPEPNRIPFNRFNKHFGSLANACAYFNIPYIAPAHTTKLYLEVKTKVLQILPTYFIEEKRWPWLKYKALLQVDMYSPLLNLAIEADGDQHYKKFSRYFKTEQEWIDATTKDKIKDEELPKHGIDLIRFHRKNLKQLSQILKPYKEKLELIQEYCAY